MTKQDEQSWRDLLANLNPYREPNTENKGQWRPELEKKIAEYEQLKEEAMAEELSFNWLFEADAQYIHKPQARANLMKPKQRFMTVCRLDRLNMIHRRHRFTLRTLIQR
ncbi:hypothetical protein FAM8374_02411 [Lacticaseibacillus paracasei]|nr:hypothetical protein FAM8374_02411 [Lacticaseibacillus paracasei]